MTSGKKTTSVHRVAMAFYQAIERMTDSELNELIHEATMLTERNCWWVEYRLKDILVEIAANEVQLREEGSTWR